ncbi:MAG TPA: Rne/Rng family ribonuclease [Bryobacteraceae bacterium]|nr:Rne/Rng family ribonuclease [Bryobacteraceae bacterium]
MSKELVISSNRHETRVAILEDDQLVEVYFQRSNEYSLAGSIHKGRVTRVLPGMQSAFVDLGLERDTFLYVSDFFEENEEYDRIGSVDEKTGRGDGPTERAERPSRADRQERPERQERQDRRPVPPQPSALAAPPLEHVPPAEAGAVPPLSDHSRERFESPEARERRGRRSRRRRSGGGGFPDSKYASDVNAPATIDGESTEPRREAEAPAEQEPWREEPRDVILLPGESLAKYSRPVEPQPRTYRERSSLPEQAVEASEPPLPESEKSASGLEAPPDEFLEQERFEAGAIPPSREMPASLEAEGFSAFPESAYVIPQPAAPEEAEPEPPSPVEAAVPASTQEADAASPAEMSEEATAEVLGEEQPETPAGEASDQPEKSDVQTASLRDQGTRYPHRGARRMRRRRGGDRGDRGERPAGDRPVGDRPANERGERPPLAEPDELAPLADAVSAPATERDRSAGRERPPVPSITELLKEGQEIIVQIAKEPLGQKGARITSHIALPGRFVVYMPTLEHLGVSRKIESDEERFRLKRILQTHRTGITGGYIVRTAGEGKSEEDIAADMAFLYNLWLDIRQKAEKKPAPLLLHHDLEIVQRILRDQLTDTFKAVWVDNEELYESVLRFMQRFQPALVPRVKMYTRSAPIFDAFNVTAELEKALRPKVWLKSGGYIVINQTEALVAIDVNTGKYVGKSNRLEDTIVKTNTEAVKEIVRQIRLRDLGGIIVVDFIDMDERKNRQKVMQTLEEAMAADRAPYKILQFNDFGLVAITRKRVKQSLERTLCSPCPTCEGAGYVKSVQTVVAEILQEAHKLRGVVDRSDVVLRTHPEVAKFLKSNTNKYLEELEEVLGRPVLVTGDATLSQDKYDLA